MDLLCQPGSPRCATLTSKLPAAACKSSICSPRTKDRTKACTSRSGFHTPIGHPHASDVPNHLSLLTRSAVGATSRRKQLLTNPKNTLIKNPKPFFSRGVLHSLQDSALQLRKLRSPKPNALLEMWLRKFMQSLPEFDVTGATDEASTRLPMVWMPRPAYAAVPSATAPG